MTSKTRAILYFLFLIIMMAGGGYLRNQSYWEYAKWTEYVALGDHSGAEAYEVGFWLTAIPGFSLLTLGALLFGMRVSKPKQ